jgi:hypothetical protein
MPLYTDLDQAVTRAKERSAAQAKDEAYIRELLQISHGIHKTTQEIVFRPFYVAAKFLEQSRRDQTLKKADKAEFTGQALPIESLLGLQRALDADLDVPPSFAIANDGIEMPSAAQLKANYDSALLTMRQFQPRGFY